MGRAADPEQFIEHRLRTVVQNALGVLGQTVEVDGAVGCGRQGAVFRLVDERTHAVLAHPGQPIQRRHLTGLETDVMQLPVHQQPPPAIGKAVVEHSGQALEQAGWPFDKAGSQLEPEWRDLQSERQELRVILEIDNAVAPGEAPDRLPAVTEVEFDP